MRGGEVKLPPRERELYVLAKSRDRAHKERAMRRRHLKELLARLRKLSGMKRKRDREGSQDAAGDPENPPPRPAQTHIKSDGTITG